MIRLIELEDFNFESDIQCSYLYIVTPDGSESKRISVADLMYGMKVNMERVVKCQYCGQPTYSDKPCLKCGGQPEPNEE